jgi:hypothetical protein
MAASLGLASPSFSGRGEDSASGTGIGASTGAASGALVLGILSKFSIIDPLSQPDMFSRMVGFTVIFKWIRHANGEESFSVLFSRD